MAPQASRREQSRRYVSGKDTYLIPSEHCVQVSGIVCVRSVSSAASGIYAMLTTHLRASIEDTATISSISGRA